jgi:hypothetical protein
MSLLGKEDKNWYAAGYRTAGALIKRFDYEANTMIAKMIGGKFIKGEDVGEYDGWHFENPILNSAGKDGNPPDFCNDLNVMHEAEKFLHTHDADTTIPLAEANWVGRYGNALIKRTGVSVPFHASARRRAESFIEVTTQS